VTGPASGPKFRVQLIQCGRCGKPRGIRHTCIRRMDSKRRTTPTKVRPRLSVNCGTCGKPRGFRHTCTVQTDFKQRRRRQAAQAKRDRETAGRRRRRAREDAGRKLRRERENEARKARRAKERERRRQAAATRRATPRGERTRRPAPKPARAPFNPTTHKYDTCRDPDCERYPCRVYRQGQEDCPLPHGA
jgi:hypothetical protein